MKKAKKKSDKATGSNTSKAKEILGRSEFLETVLESLTHPFYVIDARDYTVQMANSAARLGDITGVTTCHALTHRKNKPCGMKDHPCPLEMVKKTKKPVMVEHVHYDKDGNIRNVEVHGFPIFDNNGNVVQMIEYCLDITDRKRAEESLQFEKDKLTNILDSMEDGVYIASDQYDIQYINPALKREFGPTNGRKCYEYFYNRKDKCPWCKSQNVFNGATVRWEWCCPVNGKTYDLLDTPIRNPDGSISKLEIFRDITERKRVEESLQQSEQRYRSFVQNFQGIVFQGYLNFVPVFFHGAVEEITGYKESEFVAGRPRWDQVIHPDDFVEISKSMEELCTVPGYATEREYRIIRKDKQVRWVHELIQNVCDDSGKPSLVQGSIYDVTERKQMEEDLRQHREHLKELVQARTTELTKANEQMLKEIKRRRLLEKELLSIVEQERQRIGQELHDSIGQQLSGITFMVEVLGGKLADKSLAEEVSYAEKINSGVDKAAEQARNLAKGLYPIDLDRNDLVSAIQELASNTEQLFNVSCTLKCKNAISINDVSVVMNLYRITQEAITNAIKHGNAKNIGIGLIAEQDCLKLTVVNDGLDFPAGESYDEGMGLKIMRYRAEVINGSLDVRKSAKGGTMVTCVFSNKEHS
ncbi:MAG: PAS domain-containing sensor histidine kinase [Planctomycetota bacterium]|jgi:PAS domain S-box-containing protein